MLIQLFSWYSVIRSSYSSLSSKSILDRSFLFYHSFLSWFLGFEDFKDKKNFIHAKRFWSHIHICVSCHCFKRFHRRNGGLFQHTTCVFNLFNAFWWRSLLFHDWTSFDEVQASKNQNKRQRDRFLYHGLWFFKSKKFHWSYWARYGYSLWRWEARCHIRDRWKSPRDRDFEIQLHYNSVSCSLMLSSGGSCSRFFFDFVLFKPYFKCKRSAPEKRTQCENFRYLHYSIFICKLWFCPYKWKYDGFQEKYRSSPHFNPSDSYWEHIISCMPTSHHLVFGEIYEEGWIQVHAKKFQRIGICSFVTGAAFSFSCIHCFCVHSNTVRAILLVGVAFRSHFWYKFLSEDGRIFVSSDEFQACRRICFWSFSIISSHFGIICSDDVSYSAPTHLPPLYHMQIKF